MAKSPDDRYPSAGAMLADLQALATALSGEGAITLPSEAGLRPVTGGPKPPIRPIARRRSVPIVSGLVALILVGLALAIWKPWRKGTEPVPGPQPPAGEPIKVGVLHSLGGTMAASETVVVDATVFAIDEINRNGGLLGRPVKVVVGDGQSDPAIFAKEAERLIGEEQVSTVFGCWTSASRKTVKPIFEKHDHLLIYPVQYEGLETSPCIIYMGSAPNQQIIPAVRWAATNLKKKKVFLVGSDYVFPRTANEVIKDQLKLFGAQVVGEKYLPLGSQKVDPVVEAIRQSKPDMIMNTINGDTNTAFFHALRAAGIRPNDIPTLSFSVGE
jgi:urea transport system substrate-binding protein